MNFQAQFRSYQDTITKRDQSPEQIKTLEDKLESIFTKIDTRLDKIINLLLLNQAAVTTGPSPYRKKSRPTSQDGKQYNDMEFDHFTTLTHHQETVETVETLECIEFEMSYPTAHTHNDTLTEDNLFLPPNIQPTDQEILTIPDSPSQPDSDWLRRPIEPNIATTTPAGDPRQIPNPYKPRSGRHQSRPTQATHHLTTLNTPRTSTGAPLETLTSTCSNKASLGRTTGTHNADAQ